MKIMEIISGAGVNGAIRHAAALAGELARRGHSVTVVCRRDAWVRGEVASAPVDVIESDLRRWPPQELWRIRAAVRSRQVEVIHTHQTGAHLFGVCLRGITRVPCLATAHARTRHWHWLLHDRIIAVSEAARVFLTARNFVPAHRIEVVPNFVDQVAFTETGSETRARLRALFGVGDTCQLIGFVGTLLPEKGWLELVRVLADVSMAAPTVRLLIVGYGTPEYRSLLACEAVRLGVAKRLIWTGERLDVPEVLSALDLFVSPSREETFGLSILEAMAAGLPVVATAVGGVPELVRDGTTGILVPLDDHDAMTRAIVALLGNAAQRKALGDTGRRRARSHFSPEVQLPRIEAALARTASSRRH